MGERGSGSNRFCLLVEIGPPPRPTISTTSLRQKQGTSLGCISEPCSQGRRRRRRRCGTHRYPAVGGGVAAQATGWHLPVQFYPGKRCSPRSYFPFPKDLGEDREYTEFFCLRTSHFNISRKLHRPMSKTALWRVGIE